MSVRSNQKKKKLINKAFQVIDLSHHPAIQYSYARLGRNDGDFESYHREISLGKGGYVAPPYSNNGNGATVGESERGGTDDGTGHVNVNHDEIPKWHKVTEGLSVQVYSNGSTFFANAVIEVHFS